MGALIARKQPALPGRNLPCGLESSIQVMFVPDTKHLQRCRLFTQIWYAGPAGPSAWGSSLAGEMADVTLAGGPAPHGGEPGLPIKGLKTQVEAAWEYQAAKKSKLNTSDKYKVAALETILSSSGAMHPSTSPCLGQSPNPGCQCLPLWAQNRSLGAVPGVVATLYTSVLLCCQLSMICT